MVIYHVADREQARQLKKHGFQDAVRQVWHPATGQTYFERGVWFSDFPAPDDHQAVDRSRADYVALSVPEDRLVEFELYMPGMTRRRWFVPAAVANQYLPLWRDEDEHPLARLLGEAR
jgi:hypothetical protein